MSYPDVVIACIEHKVSLSIQTIEATLVKHDNNMKDYLMDDEYTELCNVQGSSFCDKANTHDLCCQEMVKPTQLLQCPRN